MTHINQYHRLSNALAAISMVEDIAKALGIEDIASQSDEFWETQVFAARHRFYWMCLDHVGLPLSTEREELSPVSEEQIADVAESYLRNNIDYAYIRAWYKNYGEFVVDKAFKHRREVKDLETRRLRVLIIFEKGARYLAYDENRRPLLVDEEDAHLFPVDSVSQLEKPYLIEMAKHFDGVMKMLDGKLVKVLPARTTC